MRKKVVFRCQMQDNGFNTDGHITLQECRKLFKCDEIELLCSNCPVLEVSYKEVTPRKKI